MYEQVLATREDIAALRRELAELRAALASTPSEQPPLPQEEQASVMLTESPASLAPAPPDVLAGDSAQARDERRDERVNVVGVVGGAVRFWEKNGHRGAFFNLAEHSEDGHTTWHRAVVSEKFLPRLEERLRSLARGANTEVVGYRRRRISTDSKGQERTETYVQVVALRTPRTS